MKSALCEAVTVFCVGVLPLALTASLVYQYGQPFGNALVGLAIMIFVAIIVLWLVTRVTRNRNNGDDKATLTDDPEAPAVEEVPSKCQPIPTPVFTPILQIGAIPSAFVPITNLPTVPTKTHEVMNPPISVIGEYNHEVGSKSTTAISTKNAHATSTSIVKHNGSCVP